MGRRIAIGVAWWLAAAYAFQFAAFMYGFPVTAAPIAATLVALLVAGTRPRRVGRPADRRRIYRPPADATVVGANPATHTHR